MINLGGNTGRLHLCLYFPNLAVDYWLRASDEVYPLALYTGQNLVASSVAARAVGVTEGMSITSALALLPSIQLRQFQPELAEELLHSLAQWAYGFTPYVQLASPDTLHLEVAGSLRLFHGRQALLDKITQELSLWRCEVFLGLGSSLLAAHLLAKSQALEGQPNLVEQQAALTENRMGLLLSALPVQRLGLSAAALQRLARTGFRQLGQLTALPLSSLGKRFGKETVLYLQQLRGEQVQPIPSLTLAPAFNQSLGFMYGLTDVAHLQIPLQTLLEQLKHFLRQRQLMTQRIAWRFCHEDKSLSELQISVQRAHSDSAEFFQLTCLKLEQLTWHSAIELVGLEALALTAAEPLAKSLFRDVRDQGDDIGQLIDRFYQRFNAKQFFSLQLLPEHLPDKQQRLAHVSVKNPRLQKISSNASGLMPSIGQKVYADFSACPWLCVSPQPLLQRQELLYWRGKALELVSRAMRIDSHWWQVRARRDYFIGKINSHYYQVYFCHKRQEWFMAGHYVC